MVIITKISFPRRHLNLAVTLYTGLPPVPPGVSRNGPFFQIGEERVHAISIFTLADDCPSGTLDLLRERTQIFSALPDCTCDIQEWREFREFLSGWVE